MVEDWLPLDYDKAPKVFSQKEKDAVREFMELWEAAADATHEDTQNVAWLERSVEWVRLSEFSKHALVIFEKRGRFSEETEEHFTA